MLPDGSAIMQNGRMDWNDLRYFLSVARTGSTLAAGRDLRVSQTTVARRIAALETALKLALFEKRQAGYALTPAGQALLAAAGGVEQAVGEFGEAAAALTREIGGTVRVTTEEIYAHGLLGPVLRELHDLHPNILIELHTSSAVRDLGAGHADIALRSVAGQQPSGLVGRALGDDDWALYCSRDYAARHGLPTSVRDLRNHVLIGGGGDHLWRQYQAWLRQMKLEDQVAMHHASSVGLLSSVRSGFGLAVLPCMVADADSDLLRCFAPREGHGRVLWLLTHERVRRSPSVRAVMDFLGDRLARLIKARRENAAD